MGADIADTATSARARRISAPGGLLVVCVGRFGEPILGIFGLNNTNIAQGPGRDELARLTDQRVTGVVVCQQELGTIGRFDVRQLAGVVQA